MLGSRLCAAQSRRQRQFQRFLFACTQIRPYCVGGALAHSNPWNGGLLIDDTLVAEMDVGELGVGVFEVRQRDLSGRPGRAAAGFGDAELDAVGHLDARAVLGAGGLRTGSPFRRCCQQRSADQWQPIPHHRQRA
jgi:hypothetical protein